MFESMRQESDKPLHIETMEEIFTRKKQEAREYIERDTEASDSEIDNGIRTLVFALNELPFLYTSSIGSCEGHMKSGSELAKFWPGYVAVETDDSKEAAKFIEQTRKILSKYEGAHIEDNRDNERLVSSDPDLQLPMGFIIQFGDAKGGNQIRKTKEDALRLYTNGKKIAKELEDLTKNTLSGAFC